MQSVSKMLDKLYVQDPDSVELIALALDLKDILYEHDKETTSGLKQ